MKTASRLDRALNVALAILLTILLFGAFVWCVIRVASEFNRPKAIRIESPK